MGRVSARRLSHLMFSLCFGVLLVAYLLRDKSLALKEVCDGIGATSIRLPRGLAGMRSMCLWLQQLPPKICRHCLVAGFEAFLGVPRLNLARIPSPKFRATPTLDDS